MEKGFLSYSVKLLLAMLLVFGCEVKIMSQTAPVHVYNKALYDFLDEINTAGYSDQTYIAKPLNAAEVSTILFDVDDSSMKNEQLKKRLQFYRQQFVVEHESDDYPSPTKLYEGYFKTLSRFKGVDFLYYGDGKVAVTVNPIIGAGFLSNKNGQVYTTRSGGEFKMYIDKLTIYGSVRDVHESQPLSGVDVLRPSEGALYKANENGNGSADYSESRGGVSYNLGFGEITFAKDHLSWGYGSFGTNILDANTPSFPHLKLRLYPKPWIRFEYVHAFLQSNVLDSNSFYTIGGVTRGEFHNKYLASNLLSFRLKEKTWLSVGNSIVYSQQNIEPAYLIPLAFYKSIDHLVANRSNYSGSNAQMFAAVSTRFIPKTHLYSTLFVDEISTRRMFNKEAHTNWLSFNSGVSLSNIVPNTIFTLEYLHTNAMVYKHFIETTTYQQSYYNLGHYLGDNAEQVTLQARYSPFWWMDASVSYQFARKGPDIKDDRITRNPETGYYLVQGIDFIESNEWIRNRYQLKIVLKPFSYMTISTQVEVQSIPTAKRVYDSPFYQGNLTTMSTSLQWCF